jgi:hypothetical protein
MDNNTDALTAAMLQKKAEITIQQILILSYEYVIAGIADTYSSQLQFDSIAEFNRRNKISYYLTLVYPFFVSLSDGNSEALYALYGEFYSLDFGPSSLSIHSTLEKLPGSLHYFNTNSKSNPFGIEVKDESTTFEQICRNIESTPVITNNGSRNFGQLVILNDERERTLLTDAIKKGIKLINERSNNKFFLSDEKTLLSQARYFKAFAKAYNKDELSLLSYDQVATDKGRPSYAQRTLVAAY